MGRSIVSRAIRFQTRSQYSHAAVLLPDGSVIEAWGKGGVSRNPSLGAVHTPGTEVHLFEVDTKPSRWPFAALDWSKAIDFALSKVGCRYDFRNVFRFLSRRPAAHDTGRWFCSELVFEAIRLGGLELLHGIDAGSVSPRDLSLSPFLRFVRRELTTENTEATEKKRHWFSNPLTDPLCDVLPAEYDITPPAGSSNVVYPPLTFGGAYE